MYKPNFEHIWVRFTAKKRISISIEHYVNWQATLTVCLHFLHTKNKQVGKRMLRY